MATASDVIEGALRKLKVISPEIPVEDHYITNGLTDLNDFGLQLESVFPLGFTSLSASTSDVNIPDECIAMLKSNFAIYLAPQYGLQPDPLLMREAERSMSYALSAFSMLNTSYPSSLPRGSGNRNQIENAYNTFFPKNDEQNF